MGQAAKFRKTKTGEWVVMAPVSLLHAGGDIVVAKADGTSRQVRIDRVGKAFAADGQQVAYGYIDADVPTQGRGTRTAPRQSRPMCDECGERRAVATARDMSGIVGDVCGRCKADEGSLSFC